MEKKKTRLLLVIHIPPPIHGVSMVNSYLNDFIKENDDFITKTIPIRPNKSLKTLQQTGLVKFMYSLCLLFRVFLQLIFFKPAKVYLTPTPKKVVFTRDLMLISMCKILGARTILHFHRQGLPIMLERKDSKTKWTRRVLKNTTLIHLTPYLTEKEFVSQNLHLHSTIRSIPNPLITQPTFLKNENKKGKQLLFFSNLIPEKGVVELIKAFSSVVIHIPKATLVIAGGIVGQPYYNKILKTIETEKMEEYITILANPDKTEKIQLFNQSFAFVLPSNEDCFPLVILEALSYGLPVITTTVGGLQSVLKEKEYNIHYTSNNPQELSNCIISALNSSPQLNIQHTHIKLHHLTSRFKSELVEILDC